MADDDPRDQLRDSYRYQLPTSEILVSMRRPNLTSDDSPFVWFLIGQDRTFMPMRSGELRVFGLAGPGGAEQPVDGGQGAPTDFTLADLTPLGPAPGA